MPMKKVCPRCGATFDCMHNDILSCHCATVGQRNNLRDFIFKHII